MNNLIRTLSLPALRHLRDDYLALLSEYLIKADQAKAKVEQISAEIDRRIEKMPSIEKQPMINDKSIIGSMQ
jgi:hypothetical protein